MNMRFASIALSLASLFAAEAMADDAVKFCFSSNGEYSDNDFALSNGTTKEDYWRGDENKLIRGASVTLYRHNGTSWVQIFDGVLGDGLGTGDPGIACTPMMPVETANAWYYLYADTKGYVQSQDLWVRFDSNGGWLTSELLFNHTGGPGQHDKYFTSSNDDNAAMWRVYNAAAYALYRHAGGLGAGNDFNVRVGCGSSLCPCTAGNVYRTPNVCLTQDPDNDSGSNRKYTITHELGHRLTHLVVGDKLFPANACTENPSICPASDSGDHSMGSREKQGCSLRESIAYFYAADIFNSHSQQDCAMRYAKNEFGFGLPTIDCEANGSDLSTGGSYDIRFMETNCGSSSAWPGRGVEVDWTRMFWDVHTNGTSPPSFTTIVRWVRDANAWGEFNAYEELDLEANTVGGTLNTNWDGMAPYNGIDWPQ